MDHINASAGTTGLERALLAIASNRLHVSALLTSDAIPIELLLLASAQAAHLLGDTDGASRWLRRAAWLDSLDELTAEVIDAELTALEGDHSATSPPPMLPSALVAHTLCRVLAQRTQRLERLGQPAQAVAIADLGLSLADAAGPPSLTIAADLLLHAGNSLRLLGSPQAPTYLQRAIALTIDRDEDARRRAARASLSLTCHWLMHDALEQARHAIAWPEPPPSREHAAAQHTALGAIHAAQGEWNEAARHLREATLTYQGLDACEDVDLAFAHHWLGLANAALGDQDTARHELEAAVRLRRATLGDAHPDLNESRVALGCAHEASGDLDAAIELLRESVSGFARGVGVEDQRFCVAADRLVSMLMAQGAWLDAAETLHSLIDASHGPAVSSPPELARWRALLSTIEQGTPPPAQLIAQPIKQEDVRETLVHFARGERTKAEAFRALVEHDRWSTPSQLASDAQTGVRRHGTFSSPSLAPQGNAQRWTSGIELFERAHERYPSLEINPGASAAESWTLEADELRQLTHWSQVLCLERALARLGGQADRVDALSPAFLVQLRGFPTYVSLLDCATGAPLTVLGHNGLANAAVIFTTQWAASAFAQHAHGGASLQQVTLDGRALFRGLLDQNIDGVVIDCLSPHATTMTRAIIQGALRASG